MYSPKKIITLKILGSLILSLGTIAASHHIPTSSNIALGKKIYQGRCEACHGNLGNGKTFAANALFPPPRNFTTKSTQTELSLKRMIRSVTKGRPNTAMMPWENVLSEQEILSVVNYIRQRFMRTQK
jgi:mono/diheme cytochrome c family protein